MRACLGAALRLLLLIAATCPASPRRAASDTPAAIAATLTIRKLHLVRPDLIFYPIQLEVIC